MRYDTDMMLLPMWSEVLTADLRQTFSDVYKSDNGFRPNLSQWDRASMEYYLDNRPDFGYDEVDDEWIDELAAAWYAEDHTDDPIEGEWDGIASQYQDGWV